MSKTINSILDPNTTSELLPSEIREKIHFDTSHVHIFRGNIQESILDNVRNYQRAGKLKALGQKTKLNEHEYKDLELLRLRIAEFEANYIATLLLGDRQTVLDVSRQIAHMKSAIGDHRMAFWFTKLNCEAEVIASFASRYIHDDVSLYILNGHERKYSQSSFVVNFQNIGLTPIPVACNLGKLDDNPAPRLHLPVRKSDAGSSFKPQEIPEVKEVIHALEAIFDAKIDNTSIITIPDERLEGYRETGDANKLVTDLRKAYYFKYRTFPNIAPPVYVEFPVELSQKH